MNDKSTGGVSVPDASNSLWFKPRATGKCGIHLVAEVILENSGITIPVSIQDLEDDVKQKLLDNALTYLKDIVDDLIRGDLVLFEGMYDYRNDNLAIYNGEKIIELADEPDDYGTLPSEFRVIEQGVPIDYWHNVPMKHYGCDSESDSEYKSETPSEINTSESKGIEHNTFVWFDHKLLGEISESDFEYGWMEDYGKYGVYLGFKYGDKDYRIIFEYMDVIYNESLTEEFIVFCKNVRLALDRNARLYSKHTYQIYEDSFKDVVIKMAKKLLDSDELLNFYLYPIHYEYNAGDTLFLNLS